MSRFFGLDQNDREMLLLEPFFLINRHMQGGMDWETYYNYPIIYRRWLITRIAKDLEEQATAIKERNGQKEMISNGQQVNVPRGSKKNF